MSEFWFIRHGQSETNAGLPSPSDASTPLTDKGQRQAEFVAQYLDTAPDLFVVSPYLRTRQTAAPTLEKFPNVPVETWDIHEYAYLSHELYSGTTTRDRRKLSTAFFRAADPDRVTGPSGESFNQFLERVDRCFNRLLSIGAQRVILFGHGWFIRAGLWMLYTGRGSIPEQSHLMDQVQKVMPVARLPFRLFLSFQRRSRMKDMHTFLFFSGAVRTWRTT